MTHLNKQEFQAWACGDLLANTTRGLLAEYIVATAVGALKTKRVEWDRYDLTIGDGIGVVKIPPPAEMTPAGSRALATPGLAGRG